MSRSKLLKILSTALTILTVIFAFFYAKNLIGSANFYELDINLSYMILAFILFIVFYALLAFNWMLIAKSIDESTRNEQMLSFFASQPYKYLPSSIFTFSFRAKYAKDIGMSIKDSSMAQVIENVILITGGLGLAFVAVVANESILFIALLILLLASITKMLPESINVKIKTYNRKLQKSSIINSYLIVCLAWFMAGLSFHLVGVALSSNTNIAQSIISNSFAYTAGLVAFFAPGGIGIRELVYSFFSISSSIIIVWRLLTFCVDITTGFVAILLIKYSIKKTQA